MAPKDTLSIPLTAETRDALTRAAHSHDTAGASALAGEILEEWAPKLSALRAKVGAPEAAAILLESADWDDDPADFFPQINDFK
jgi:hypothetical protein